MVVRLLSSFQVQSTSFVQVQGHENIRRKTEHVLFSTAGRCPQQVAQVAQSVAEDVT